MIVQTWLMYGCLMALAVLVPVGVAMWLAECGALREVRALAARFRRLPWFAQVVLLAFAVNMWVYGSTKTNSTNSASGSTTNETGVIEGGTTNGVSTAGTPSNQDGGETNDVLGALCLVPGAGAWADEGDVAVDGAAGLTMVATVGEEATGLTMMVGVGNVWGGGFTEEDLTNGYVMVGVGTNEVWNFSMPTDAVEVAAWRMRGAYEDWTVRDEGWGMRDEAEEGAGIGDQGSEECVASNRVTILAWGGVVIGDEVFWPGVGAMSVLPACRWGTNAASRVWHRVTRRGSLVVTWENALRNRDTNTPGSVQCVFDRHGDWEFRYGLSAVTNGVTSRRFHRLRDEEWQVEDCDGDGLSSYDELMTYGTSPRLADTDGDGIDDGTEIAQGSDPRDPDEDDDGIIDGGDNDLSAAMSRTDEDGDGIPDAYENYWFGSTSVWDDLEERDENGFTLATMMSGGQHPSDDVPTETEEVEGRLSSICLWPRFAATWTNETSDVVYERTITVNRESGWQSFYLSGTSDGAAAWSLKGLTLEWEDSGGASGTFTGSPTGDSVYLPLSEEAETVTFRLRATRRRVRSLQGVYLLQYMPEVTIGGGQEIELSDGGTASVFTQGSKSQITVTIDRSGRPCLATPGEDELTLAGFDEMDGSDGFTYSGDANGGTITVEGAGDYELPSFALGEMSSAARTRNGLLMMSANGGGEGRHHVIVLDPSVWYGTGHGYSGWGLGWDGSGYSVTSSYPLDSACLVREWHHDDYGWTCDCEPGVSSGAGEGAAYVTTSLSYDPTTATGSVLVDGHVVWTGTATHSGGWEESWGGGGIEYEGGCCADCADGNCDALEGPGLDSLKFRIPLGAVRKNQVAGFVYFEAEGAVTIGTGIFQLMARDDVSVTTQTSGSSKIFSCSAERCRDVQIDPITGGVRLTVRDHAAGTLEHTWEVTNVGGSANHVRLRKVSRIGNQMECWEYRRTASSGDWQAVDAQTGVYETLERDDQIASGGTCTETRCKYAADGTLLGTIERIETRIGERENAVLCETSYRETTGNNVIERSASYWEDSEHRLRNGKLKLLTATDAPWVYHAWDADGREVLRVEERDGSEVPGALCLVPCATAAMGLAALPISQIPAAYATVYEYTPVSGDDADDQDVGKVRCETKYVIADGAATCIAKTWHKYTHSWSGGYPTVRHDIWRACAASASFGNAGNAHSYRVELDAEAGWYIPFALHGKVIEELDEDGRLTETEIDEDGDTVTETTTVAFGGTLADTYAVTERNATYGTVQREATYLTADDTLVDETLSTYDDRNRLCTRTYFDGTVETNVYSCCRKLWSVDREGKKVLRSAVTGEDEQYWAEEDIWLREIATGGVHRVTQHFCDGFGRETNTVVYLAETAGEAVLASASDGRRIRSAVTAYDGLKDDKTEATDVLGLHTSVRKTWTAADDTTVTTVSDGAGAAIVTAVTETRGGEKCVRKCWDGKWTETDAATTYGANGCKVVTETLAASDHETVTTSVKTYDFLGRLVQNVTPLGTTTYQYDGTSGRVTGETTTAGDVTRAVTRLYDASGNEIGRTERGVSSRSETLYEEDTNGWWKVERLVVVGNETNAVSETRTQLTGRESGVRSRTVKVKASGERIETTVAAGTQAGETVETEVSSVGGTTVRIRRYGLLISETTATGTTRYAYNGLGECIDKQTVRIDDETGTETEIGRERYEYAATGLLAATVAYTNVTDGARTEYGYDAFGRTVSETDANGQTVTTGYDAEGRVTSVGGAANPERYGYDTAGRCTSLQTTRNGTTWDTTTWTYDPATGNCTAKQYADGSGETSTYAADGQRVRTTLPSGKWTENTYDATGRQTGVASSDGLATVAYGYDADGRIVSETGSVASYVYGLDATGSASNETITVAGESVVIERVKDGAGRIVERGLVSPDAEQTVRQVIGYDALGRVASVSDGVTSVSYAYDAQGRDAGWTTVCAGGATIRREVVREAYTGRIAAITNWVNGTAAVSFAYGYDGVGAVVSRKRTSGGMVRETTFTYDAAGQLAEESVRVGTNGCLRGFGYDRAGNFTWRTDLSGTCCSFSANALNQYVSVGGTAGANAADGGLSRWGGATLAYDAAARLRGVSGANGANETHDYDGQGRRVRKIGSDGTHRFFHDGWNLVLERLEGADGTTNEVRYAWGRDIEGTLDAAGGVEALVYVETGSGVRVPLYDGFGNVVGYVDGATGAVVAEYEYDGFGGCIAATGTGSGEFRFRYATKYTEAGTDFVYYGRRFYVPALGRWASRDPVGEDGGANLYRFCENAPTWKWDVLGALTWQEAYRNYLTGEKKEMEMPFSEIDTSGVKVEDFAKVSGYLSSCSPNSYDIGYSGNTRTLHTSGGQAIMLGDITLALKGTLTISNNGNWSFGGTMKCEDDTLDFSPNGKNFLRDAMTVVAGSILGKGHPFKIKIVGTKPMSGSGNCCAKKKGWWW